MKMACLKRQNFLNVASRLLQKTLHRALISGSLQWQSCVSTTVSLTQQNQHTNSSSSEEKHLCQDVVSAVRNQIQTGGHGRLFAVVHMNSKQFKITAGDLILLHTNDVFPDVGERIMLEKVLCVGGTDFTLVGQPLLDNVKVEATIVEKTLSYHKVWFSYRRRKNSRKLKMVQDFQTILRINSIDVNCLEEEVD